MLLYTLFSNLVGHIYIFIYVEKKKLFVLDLCTKGQKLEFVRQNGGNPQKPVIRIVLEINRYKPCLITSKEMIERTIERSKFCSLLNYVKSCFSRESFVSAQKFDVQAQCQSLSRKKIKICQNNTMHCVMISMTCRHL